MDTEVPLPTLFYLSSARMDVMRPFFPRSRGIPKRLSPMYRTHNRGDTKTHTVCDAAGVRFEHCG